MSKSNSTRLTETVNYLKGVDQALADEVSRLLQAAGDARRDRVSEQISLSGQTPLFGGERANNTDTQRDALRALLLCQRVYLSNLWSPHLGDLPFAGEGRIWPQYSVQHWRFAPEQWIRDGIRMYTTMKYASKMTFANAARTRSEAADTYFTARRGGGNPPVGNSCFDQVSHWLLHAGYVSLRWIARYKPAGFDYRAFGAGREWISRSAAIPQTPFQIERGMIVRMYTQRRIGGHFMVSDGGGWGWGYNNSAMDGGDGEEDVPNGHARCLIHRQFGEYREPSDRIGAHDLGGILVLLDPDLIPDAC